MSFYKANGKDKAFAEINNPNGKLQQGDLYIFVYDSNGVVAAHGADASEVGLDISTRQDNNGKFFGKELMQIGAAGGG